MADGCPKAGALVAPAYLEPLVFGLSIQLAVWFTTATMLDMGITVREFARALLCQCLAVLLIVWRRPVVPLRSDLLFIRFGIFASWFIVIGISPFAAWLKGQQLLGASQTLADYYFDRGLGACFSVLVAAVLWLPLWGLCLAVRQLRAFHGRPEV